MKKLAIIFLTGFIVLTLYGFYTWRNLNKEKQIDETRLVYVKQSDKGYQLLRNGKPFFIRGASGNSHFKELVDIGGNTIRVYDTLNLDSVLNEAQKNNLAVIVDIYIPRFRITNNPYLIEEDNIELKENIKLFVKKYKNHPAILFWNLGNELQYPVIVKKNRIAQNYNDLVEIYQNVLQRNSFINTFNELIDIIHNEDPNHPVTTSIATNNFWKKILSIHLHSPKLDIIGINVFGPIENTRFQISVLSGIITFLPFYISEWGTAGPWEQEKTSWGAPIEPTSTKKGEQYKEKYMTLNNTYNQSLGSVAFYWGQKQERTHTWFNIFDENGRKSQILYDLKHIWQNHSDDLGYPPQIKYMLVDKKGAGDNIVFKPNDLREARLFLEGKIDSTLSYNWEIHEEGWNYEGEGVSHKMTKKISESIVATGKTEINEVVFRVPEIEGPYRIFCNVYDKNGNFATANTPFYVLNPDE